MGTVEKISKCMHNTAAVVRYIVLSSLIVRTDVKLLEKLDIKDVSTEMFEPFLLKNSDK